MKAVINSYGGVEEGQEAAAKLQESRETMRKRTMARIQPLNNCSFESSGLRVRKAYNVGPGSRSTPAQVEGFGTPQGQTHLPPPPGLQYYM